MRVAQRHHPRAAHQRAPLAHVSSHTRSATAIRAVDYPSARRARSPRALPDVARCALPDQASQCTALHLLPESTRGCQQTPPAADAGGDSERIVAISYGLFRILLHDRDARRRQRRCQAPSPTSPRRLIGAASDANEITARQRHLGDGGHNGRAIQRVRCRRLHRRLGLTHRSTAARHRPAATSSFPSVQNRSPQSTGGVSARGSPMHVSMRRCLPPNISPNAQYCRIGRGNLRPPCRNLRLLASQIYAWWLMVFPGAKRRVNHGVA